MASQSSTTTVKTQLIKRDTIKRTSLVSGDDVRLRRVETSTKKTKGEISSKVMSEKLIGGQKLVISALERVNKELLETQSKLEVTKSKLNETQSELESVKSEVEWLKMRMDCMERRTVDGLCIWEIPNVSTWVKLAEDRASQSIESPPFYTSPHGYKFIVRLFLNGEKGEGRYISLYLVAVKGEYDEILKWPMKPVSVDMSIINHVDRAQDYILTVKMSKNWVSYKRPGSGYQIGSGFEKGAKKEILKNTDYVKEDKLWIRTKIVVVDADRI